MSKICPLFSGSTGNSTYISTKEGSILVDAGASFKGLKEALARVDAKIEDLSAIAVTHEHSDHIKGLKTLLKNTKTKLIASTKTIEALAKADLIPSCVEVIAAENREISVGGIIVNRFATNHDCEGSSGFSFLLPDGKKASVCTDLGIVTDEVRLALSGSDLVLLESNHDIEMLKRGPYPPLLKVRIMGDSGHISNNACAAELPHFLRSGTTRFVLGHLSQNNNTPLLARSAAEAALMDIGAENGKDYILKVATPFENEVMVI